MLDRDTDQDWREIGASEPFFGVFTHERFLSQNLSPEVLTEFWETGVDEIAYLRTVAATHFPGFNPQTAIDFGCGVGRLTRAIAGTVSSVTGVDVSPGMLEHARQGAPDNTNFQHEIPQAPVDWIVSMIVFQHIFPTQGYQLFRALLEKLAPGGVMTLHFTIYKDATVIPLHMERIALGAWDGARFTAFAENPPPEGSVLMFDYDLSRLMAISHSCGVEKVWLEHTNHGGCHGVVMYGQKAS